GEMELKGFGEPMSILEAFDPTAISSQDVDWQAVLSVSLGGFSSVYEDEEQQFRAILALVRLEVALDYGAAAVRGVQGGGVLVLSNAAQAVKAALEIQRSAAKAALSPRIGIALGDAGDVRSSPGPAVNIAVRLGRLAEPGGIVVSSDVY